MSGEASPGRVLVVEDEPDLAALYAEWLDGSHEVVVTHSGEEALETIDETVDVVLLDRRLPGLSGGEVLERIRDREVGCRVIMVTAVEPGFDIVEMGFDGYLSKPVDSADLLEAVDRAVTRIRHETLLQEYYSLIERRSALEAMPDVDVTNRPEYRDLTERLEEVRGRIETFLEEFETDRLTAAIERIQNVSALREREQRYRSVTEDVLDSSRVGTVIVDADGELVWANAAIGEFFGLDREAVVGEAYERVVRDRLGAAVEDGAAFADRVVAALSANDGPVEFQCHLPAAAGRPERWLTHWSKPIEMGLYAGGRMEHYYDITALKARERTLERLHGATRDLIAGATPAETGDHLVEAASRVLGFASAVLYLEDGATGRLVPTASVGPGAGEAEPIDDPADRVWQALVDGEARTTDPGESSEASEFLVPVGTHGVLVLAGPGAGEFEEADVSFARLLAANAEVTLDRAERELALSERDEELERRNAELARLNRINTIIRGIGRALVDSPTRSAVESAVCDRLVRVDTYEFVWIGEPDVVDDRLRLRAEAGGDGGYLDRVGPAGPGTALEVLRTGSVRTVGNLLEETADDAWRGEALRRGYRSVIAVPLRFEGSVYGVLEVYASRPYAFDGEERDVLAELGETIGHALNAQRRKDALMSETTVELELELGRTDGVFERIAELVEDRIDLRTIVPNADGSYTIYLEVPTTDPEDTLERARGAGVAADVRLISERAESVLVRFTVEGGTVVTTIATHGGVPHSISATSEGCRVTVGLPQTIDAREFVRALAEDYPSLELIARRDRSRAGNGDGTLLERLDNRLTDRQQEALQTAYFAGYYDWPRENDGETIAETMDISRPTLQQHLRAGERKLLEALFESS